MTVVVYDIAFFLSFSAVIYVRLFDTFCAFVVVVHRIPQPPHVAKPVFVMFDSSSSVAADELAN